MSPRPWDRRPGETTRAWAAFVEYRDLGHDRSLTKVATELGKQLGQTKDWSSRWQWVARCAAYDAHEDQAHQRRLRSRRTASETRLLRIVDLGLEKLEKALEAPMELSDPGKAARFMGELVKIERLIMGEPTSSLALTGGPGNAPTFILLSDEEKQDHLRSLQAELARRAQESP